MPKKKTNADNDGEFDSVDDLPASDFENEDEDENEGLSSDDGDGEIDGLEDGEDEVESDGLSSEDEDGLSDETSSEVMTMAQQRMVRLVIYLKRKRL